MEKDLKPKIALFAPSQTGKSTYKATLLRKDVDTIETPTNLVNNRNKQNDVIQKIIRRELVPVERNHYNIIDLPGREEDKEQRLNELASRVVGSLLFYDASNPSSAQKLLEMTKEELLDTNYIRRQTGVAIFGNKQGQTSFDAVWTGKKLKDRLNSIISQTWKYDVPHLLISCQAEEDVYLSFWLMAKLIPSHKVSKEVVRKYSAKHFFRQARKRKSSGPGPAQQPSPPKPTPKKSDSTVPAPDTPSPPSPQPTNDQPVSTVETPEGEPPKEEETPDSTLPDSISLYSSEGKERQFIEKLIDNFSEVKKGILCRVKGEKIFLAFYPGEHTINQVPTDSLKRLIDFNKKIDNYKEQNIVEIQNEGDWYLLTNIDKTIVLLETNQAPSEKLKEFFKLLRNREDITEKKS